MLFLDGSFREVFESLLGRKHIGPNMVFVINDNIRQL